MNMLQLPDASLCVRLAATMGHFLWQGAAVYLLVIFASLLLGRASAGARYAVFAAALLVMAVCPPVTFVALRSPETPAMSGAGQSPPHVRSDDTVMRPEMPSAFLGGQSPPYPSEPVVPPSAETVSLNVPPEPAAEAIDWWRYAPYLVGCYLGGTSLMLARLLVALCGGQRLRRRSEPVDDSAILAAFARQARALGLRFTPAIAFCRDVAVPTVVGVLRPMILLPLSAASGLTTEQIEVLLAHELAHIRRYDYLVNILQRLIEAVLFFHPAVWFVSRRIRIEREHCCDDLVLAVGGQRFAYAESLVRMAELSTGGQSPPYMAAAAVALGAADRPSQLRLRILRLVSGSTGEPVRLLRPAVFGLCVFLMLAVVACIRLTSSRTYDRAVDAMPAGMVGTWFFENPMGDDEQMAVFADGRIVVLYSNGHRDETQYTDGRIELDEYANLKAKLLLLPDGRTLQTSGRAQGIAKLWQRIDAVPKTELLRPLMEAPAAPAATPPPTQPADAPAWGEAVDGLQAAVELVPAKEAYAYGEKIDVRFRVRNVSDRTIPIATATQRQDRAEVRDDGGTIREVPAKWYSGWPRIVRHELKPGQEVTLESTGLGIVQEWQEMESPWRQTGVILKGKPGRYAIRYLLPFPDVRWERPDGTVSVPQPTDWQGTLKTGWRELTVKLPNDAAERRTAAAEAVRLPDSLAWAFDPTPGLEIGAHESRLRFRLGTKTLDLDVVDGKARAAWSDGAKQNEVVGKVVRIDRPASGDSGASAREPVLIDVVDGKPLTNDAASPLLDATRPSFVKGKLRFRGWGSASHLIDTHEGKLRIWEPDTLRMIESQGLRYGGSAAAPSTAPAARPDTRPAPGGDVGGRSGDLPYGTVSLGQPEAPERLSLAWYLLRQRAVAPLLTELPIRLAGAQEASVLESPVWRGHPGGISVELGVRFEGKFSEDDGDLVIGFFSDPKWSRMPLRAIKLAGAGRHTITGIPPGKYQIGAMIGDLADPAAMGVHKSWPQPVEVVSGKSNAVEVLLSSEFNYSLGSCYKSVIKSLLPGHTVQHPDRLVEGRVTDATGKPVRHVVVGVGETAGEPAPGKNAVVVRYATVGTDEEGRYSCDEVDAAYTLGVNLTQSLPELFGCRWQSIDNFYRVYRGPKTADFVLDPVSSGTAALAGEVYDQDGKPLKEFVLNFRTLPEYAQPPEILKRKLKSALKLDGSDKDERDLSERLVGYRLTCLSPDGRFSFSDLPPGWYRVSPMAFDFESYEDVPSQDVALANGETMTLKFVVKHKRVLYGRVLLSDGSVPPAAVRPPYKDGRILLTFREEGRSMSGDQVGFVEPDGHVRVLLTAAQHSALTRDMGFIGIDYPMVFRRDLRESNGSRHVGVYPLDQLSPDRDKAGEVRLRYPEPPDAEPVATQPASVGEVGGRSGDLPYGTARPEAQEIVQRLASPDSDPRMRETAAETLGGLREPSAVEALIAALKDGDVGVRKAAAGALERSGWKPADREQRIRYLLALDKWDEAVAAGPAAKPADKAANQAEGRFELDIPIVIALKKGDEGPGGFPRHSVVQFRVVEKRLQAVLDVRFSSWPQTKWLFAIDVLDAAGKVLAQATATHVTSGAIARVPFEEPAEIQFRFSGAADPAKAVGFRIGVESVSTNQGNPIAFDEELPLRLALNAIEYSNAIEAKWIRFDRSKDRFGASVRVSLLSWPKAKYRVRVEIPGPENRVLAHAEQVIESAGVIERVPSVSEETLRFDLGSAEVLEEAAQPLRYAVWLERVDDQAGATTRPPPAGLQGTVFLPDGKPAVGAQVVLLLAEHEARFVDGRFEREVHNRTESKPDGILAVTDADGQFNFPARPACFAVAILHDEGYIELPLTRLTESPIPLRPWSRVEGMVLGLDKFRTSRPVDHLVTYRTYGRDGLGERGWQQENANINLRYNINPDSQGRFIIERVPPGECWLKREWVRRQADSEVHLSGGETRFEIGPGQTTRVTVGGMRRVVGRLLAAVDADFQISPKNTRIRYFLEATGFHVDSSGVDPVFNAYQEFLRSDEGKAYSGDVSPAEDGSFEIRDLPPARYFMQVRVVDPSGQEGKKDKVLGWITSGFDLTAGVGDADEAALDVGTVEVQPGEDSPRRDWGEAVEGLQCRLWAGRTHLRIGQSPELATAIRNRGNRELSVARSQELCELQVDGRWYRWADEIDVRSSHFPPGGEFGGISIFLGPQWQAKDDGAAKLDLRPGRHTIRVAFIAQPGGPDVGQPVRVVSNPIEIEIAGAAGDAPRTTLPETVSSSESRQKTGVKLDFLSEIPEFHELTLTITEDALKDLAKKNNLTVQMSENKRDRTYHLFRSDGENVIVMFAGGKCKGIQRMRKDPGFAQITLEGRWAKGRVIDGAGKKFGIEGPVYVFDPADPKLETSRPMSARSPMLDIREIEFMNRDNYPRVDVAFQFRDGKTAGGVLFEMTLFDKNKAVLGTQRVLELRNREMPKQVFASFIAGGDDPPNRSGKAELYFRDVSLADVDSYRLIVSEPDVAGLIRLLDEEDTYPRESAARALGQLGSAEKPAVPKLTQMLDDPEPYPRDAARQALQRIGERGTDAGVPATFPAARPRVVERPHRPVTMPAVTSRDTRPLFGASQPATQLAVRVIPLVNVQAERLGQTVRNVVGRQPDKPVIVNDDLRGNFLLIWAAEDELDRIAYLVAQLDKPPSAHAEKPTESMYRVAKILRPKHAKATDVAEAITSLYSPSRAAGPALLRSTVNAAADKERKAVMISCDPSMEKEIDALVAQLDTAEPTDDFIKVFHLPNANLGDLGKRVQEWIGSARTRVRLTVDHPTSSLIVQAKRIDIQAIAELLRKVDRATGGSEQMPGASSSPATRPAGHTAPTAGRAR
jgi:beta-lactamase regulating signal transducer with metallopeptidase domain